MQPKVRYRSGDRIGDRYLVHKALAGGMGEVYLCLDVKQNLPFALKTFQARYLTEPKARAYFEREAATWVALEKHPNVVRCFYMETVDNTPFLLLEWVAGDEGSGTDLRGWLDRRGPLEPRRALEFTLDVCRALEHAQRKVPGFVHCDIKPENVLLAQGRLAKLTDFGLAKLVREAGLVSLEQTTPGAGSRWQVSSAGGTPPYMAPEQWRGEPVDPRTDVYAVGCLLYELLTGRWPFQADTLDGLKRRHLGATPPTLGAGLREATGEGLDRLLARCLAKEKAARYPSASELIAAIVGLFEVCNWEPPRALPATESFTANDYSNRGVTYAAFGRHTDALADHDAAMRINPCDAHVYVARGAAYAFLGRHIEALADYVTAIRIDPNYAHAYCNRGVTYVDMGRYPEALADYDAAIRIDPNYATAYSNRGLAHAALGRQADALADYNEAIRIEPDFALSYLNRGLAYAALGHHTDALADYDAAIQIDPNLALAHFNRGAVYAALGRHAEALTHYDAAIRIDRNFAAAHYNRAATYFQLGRHAEALADYDAAIRIDSKDAKAYVNRGNTYLELSRHSEALADYEAAIRIHRDFAPAYVNKGVLHYERREWEDALSAFEAAERLGDDSRAQYAAQVRRALAFEAFFHADTPSALRRALERYPILARRDFIALLEQFVVQEVPPAEQPAFRQRLDLLRQFIAQKGNP